MLCQKSFTISVALECDTFQGAGWTEVILDPDSTAAFSMAGGDGTFFVTLTGTPGHQGVAYQYTSDALECSSNYNATIEIDYSIDLTDVGAGSNAEAQWQVRRNGVLVINTNKVAPDSGNLTESGTLSSGPLVMVAGTPYTFQVNYSFIAIGAGTSSDVSGVIRFRPLTPP